MDESARAQYLWVSVLFTVRAPEDFNIIDKYNNPLKSEGYHFLSLGKIPGTMSNDTLYRACQFWEGLRRGPFPELSRLLLDISNSAGLWEAFRQEWETLEECTVEMLDEIFEKGKWSLG